jgi:hypothetical protein
MTNDCFVDPSRSSTDSLLIRCSYFGPLTDWRLRRPVFGFSDNICPAGSGADCPLVIDKRGDTDVRGYPSLDC